MIQETSLESLSKMKGAFKKDGVGTAGNASIISDGAAAIVVMSGKRQPRWAARFWQPSGLRHRMAST